MTAPSGPPRRLISLARPALAWLLALGGAVALFLGWWGVSGTPLPGKQIPYLVSGGLVGVALLVLAAAAFATQDVRSQLAALQAVEQRVEELYRLLTEETVTSDEQRVAVPGGKTFHRASCRLAQGRDGVKAVSEAQLRRRGLTPCRLCDPELA